MVNRAIWRRPTLGAALTGALALAACGGGGSNNGTPTGFEDGAGVASDEREFPSVRGGSAVDGRPWMVSLQVRGSGFHFLWRDVDRR